jgi:hypothetical protein
MNTENTTINKTVEGLAAWLRNLIEEAKADTPFAVSWFRETDYDSEPFCIVGGWSDGFSEEYDDILCISKSSPKYAMCVKIVVNDGPYAYADFDSLDMPLDLNGEVEDTCISLDLDEDVEGLAAFLWNELERITKEHEVYDE